MERRFRNILTVSVFLVMGAAISHWLSLVDSAQAVSGFARTVAFNTEVSCPNGSYTQLPDIAAISYALLYDPSGTNDIRVCTTQAGDACAVAADGFPLNSTNPSFNDDHNNTDAWRCLGDGGAETLFIAGSRGQ